MRTRLRQRFNNKLKGRKLTFSMSTGCCCSFIPGLICHFNVSLLWLIFRNGKASPWWWLGVGETVSSVRQTATMDLRPLVNIFLLCIGFEPHTNYFIANDNISQLSPCWPMLSHHDLTMYQRASCDVTEFRSFSVFSCPHTFSMGWRWGDWSKVYSLFQTWSPDDWVCISSDFAFQISIKQQANVRVRCLEHSGLTLSPKTLESHCLWKCTSSLPSSKCMAEICILRNMFSLSH